MYSIIFGILASVLPNLVFAWLYFKADAGRPVRFIRFVYLYEGLKLAVFAALCSAFMRWPGVQISKFFTALLLCELLRFVYTKTKLARVSIK